MAKKKNNKPTIVNNIESIHIDIDYEKLADAIVKAQNKAESKEEKSGRFRTIFMRICNWIIYLGIYLFAVVCVWGFWNVEAPNWQTWVVKIVFIAVSVAIAALMFFTQIESFKDSKKEVQNYFNVNISFIALLVAIIALLKEVI